MKIANKSAENENKVQSVYCTHDNSFCNFYQNYYLFCLLQFVFL